MGEEPKDDNAEEQRGDKLEQGPGTEPKENNDGNSDKEEDTGVEEDGNNIAAFTEVVSGKLGKVDDFEGQFRSVGGRRRGIRPGIAFNR